MDYGLSTTDILSLSDKELNQIVGLKRMVPYREERNPKKSHFVGRHRLTQLRSEKKMVRTMAAMSCSLIVCEWPVEVAVNLSLSISKSVHFCEPSELLAETESVSCRRSLTSRGNQDERWNPRLRFQQRSERRNLRCTAWRPLPSRSSSAAQAPKKRNPRLQKRRLCQLA